MKPCEPRIPRVKAGQDAVHPPLDRTQAWNLAPSGLSTERKVVDVSFVVPCYNEEANVVATLKAIEAAVSGRDLSYEIIVIDDASTDQTSLVVEGYRASFPQSPVVLHRNKGNKGLGYNYFYGASLAWGEYYMAVFGDNELPVDAISAIVDRRGEADMVIPYFQDMRARSPMRRLVSWGFTCLVNLIGGHRIRYYNGPVLHRRDTVERMKSRTTGFAYQAELLCRALSEGYSYVETPIPCGTRQYGRVSAFRLKNIMSVLASLARLLRMRVLGA